MAGGFNDCHSESIIQAGMKVETRLRVDASDAVRP